MKRILLASASIVAFAGAAAAEVTFGGEATLGYNDTDTASDADDDLGFYWDLEVGTTLTQELDNGITAAATFEFDVVDNDLGVDLEADSFVLSLTSDVAGLYFGDTAQAADSKWVSAGDMAQDGFSETDGEDVIRGDFAVYGIDTSVSAIVDNTTEEDDDGASDDVLDQYSIGMDGNFGQFGFVVAYQSEEDDLEGASGDFNPEELLGVSVSTAFAGADVRLAYARDMTNEDDSTGIEVAYPVGPVTVGGYYVIESADGDDDTWGVSADYTSGPITVATFYEHEQDGSEDWAIEGSYDLNNGLIVLAGVSDAGDDYYVASTYELGGGAQLLASFAEDDDDDSEDEIGDPEYQDGATIEVSFEF
ncbi:porin [Limimaricola pyoseonensis]|uniref:Porin n=1 Tax=Limimaricola pyoseonensis TaxID=521013 RepID=A0A1G7F142_9RHOB|nr:porin [Limimaricola pyoseonensis]SDE69663.1 porin [Limimaricola pyoseonensis]